TTFAVPRGGQGPARGPPSATADGTHLLVIGAGKGDPSSHQLVLGSLTRLDGHRVLDEGHQQLNHRLLLPRVAVDDRYLRSQVEGFTQLLGAVTGLGVALVDG